MTRIYMDKVVKDTGKTRRYRMAYEILFEKYVVSSESVVRPYVVAVSVRLMVHACKSAVLE